MMVPFIFMILVDSMNGRLKNGSNVKKKKKKNTHTHTHMQHTSNKLASFFVLMGFTYPSVYDRIICFMNDVLYILVHLGG